MEASEAVEQTQEAPESGAEQQQEGEQTGTEELSPALKEQFANLEQKIAAGREPDEEPDFSESLISEPEGLEEYEGFEDPDQLEQLQEQYADPYQQFQQEPDVNELVQQQVAEAMQPVILNQRTEEIRKIESELGLDDEAREKVVNAMFETFGDGPEGLAFRTDPAIVRRFAQAAKAEVAAADETPAEEAAQEGAAIETGAGPSNQGEEDPDAEWKDKVFPKEGEGNKVPFL